MESSPGLEKDDVDSNGTTALMHAADHGRMDMVRFLLEVGADKDLGDTYGNTALIRASQHNHVETARLLLQAGWDELL